MKAIPIESKILHVIKDIEARSHLLYLGLMCCILLLQNVVMSSVLAPALNQRDNSQVVFDDFSTPILIPLFISPLFETLIFQAAAICVLQLFELKQKTIILLSGLIFGLAHFMGLNYLIVVFSAILAGFLFSGMYLFRLKRSGFFWATTDVVFVHAINNTVIFIDTFQ
ncbi:CPBP family intramembrane metalloprotease [Undibacterium sp. CY7W]|uniref:CPBP family intramembrane metalloprotease n=1 Tax=Undibacterium rugosum TaxID=2762291 RepID=A0A923KRY3_9BURK|nr:CPBP family intramembrane glutamic endopeptidase [Undibacterium rugosum]MBC3934339.1 CPBP family intramembrane metalloprotease [Undibacterium rugosum]